MRGAKKDFLTEKNGNYINFRDPNGEFIGSIWSDKDNTTVTLQNGKNQKQFISRHPDGTIDTKCEYDDMEGSCTDKDGTTY